MIRKKDFGAGKESLGRRSREMKRGLRKGMQQTPRPEKNPTPTVGHPNGSPNEKNPILKMMEDELQKLRKEHEEETAKLQAEHEKAVKELKQQLATKNKPQPEEEEKCNKKSHIGLEDKIKDLEKDIADKNAIIEALSTQNEENDPTSKISFEKLRDGKAKKDYFLPKE
ncbi:2596_t:CDS:2 [Cetraspora pellucida]|uniref:2596_t:CDS:1 n=1 Tax=Cetraspora pellucida TaxID=1433469 RepID=A0ACA9R0N3_9GLOM|nr:2596_t:CDS:2 [Cetraspora pellucida]